jgi:hypothetical protein
VSVLPDAKPIVDRASSVNELAVLSHALDFMAGGAELGELVRACEWSKTPLGLPEQWPQNL